MSWSQAALPPALFARWLALWQAQTGKPEKIRVCSYLTSFKMALLWARFQILSNFFSIFYPQFSALCQLVW
jgi:hypothetical protein